MDRTPKQKGDLLLGEKVDSASLVGKKKRILLGGRIMKGERSSGEEKRSLSDIVE